MPSEVVYEPPTPVIVFTVDCAPCPTAVAACPMAVATAFDKHRSPTTGHDGRVGVAAEMSGLGTGLLGSDQGQGLWVRGLSSRLDPLPSRVIYTPPQYL